MFWLVLDMSWTVPAKCRTHMPLQQCNSDTLPGNDCCWPIL